VFDWLLRRALRLRRAYRSLAARRAVVRGQEHWQLPALEDHVRWLQTLYQHRWPVTGDGTGDRGSALGVEGEAPPVFGDFASEERAGRPRILFVGEVWSTHAHSWLELLRETDYNIRFFAIPQGLPRDDFPWPTYVTERPAAAGHPLRRGIAPWVYDLATGLDGFERGDGRAKGLPREYLAWVIRRWRPDVIHTLGLTPASEFLYSTQLDHTDIADIGRWIIQLRGGSDLFFSHADPARQYLAIVVKAAHAVISDNEVNYTYLEQMGVPGGKRASLGTVPGTGGIDIESLEARWDGPPSGRRLILWPKAYEAPWAKALPVLEALEMAWSRIQPCRLVMSMTAVEVRDWIRFWPEEMRGAVEMHEHLPRREVLALMPKARVLLGPTLVDGVPNTMFEAMASGAVPVISPIVTVSRVVAHEENVFFARNLYPEEIAAQLVRAMNDDQAVDAMAERNRAVVRRLACRRAIRERVLRFYADVLTGST